MREKGVLPHTDAVQAAGHLPIDVQAQHIDMLEPPPATSSTAPRAWAPCMSGAASR